MFTEEDRMKETQLKQKDAKQNKIDNIKIFHLYNFFFRIKNIKAEKRPLLTLNW